MLLVDIYHIYQIHDSFGSRFKFATSYELDLLGGIHFRFANRRLGLRIHCLQFATWECNRHNKAINIFPSKHILVFFFFFENI